MKGIYALFLETCRTCHVFGFTGKHKDRKIKAGTRDREGDVKSGRCQAGLVVSVMKTAGHSQADRCP